MSEFKIGVVDVETTVYNTQIGTFSGNPHHPDNVMVSVGLLHLNDGVYQEEYHDPRTKSDNGVRHLVREILQTFDLLVGHNIKFDLLYFQKECTEDFFNFVARGGAVWDTMVCDYVLSGQTHSFTPLSSEWRVDDSGKKYISRPGLALRYGGTDKPDKIKEYWNAGVMTEDIPVRELLDYQQGDVKNTALIFEGQSREVVDRDMMAVTTVSMDALLALTEIEYNGMNYDRAWAGVVASNLQSDIDNLRLRIKSVMNVEFPANLKTKINPDSDTQISRLLFGGNMVVRGTQPMLDKTGLPMFYKSGVNKGKPRTKLKYTTVVYKGWLSDIEKRNKKGDHPVGDEVLQELIDKHMSYKLSTDQVDFIKSIQSLRALRKEVSTYYIGYSENTWPHDECIHASFNQVVTPTARLSCTNPNLQNVKRDK